MYRSPRPLRRCPPAPRSPSSRSAPVIRESGITSPVGWNWTISMSRSGSPARYASAIPSAALSAEHATTLYMVGPPPIVRLPGERLLMDPSLGGSVEEAAVARLELEHPPGRLHDQGPHELLVVDPAAAGERVEKVRVERVGLGEHGVVAALHHARAA